MKIKDIVEERKYLSIITDEVTDRHSNKEIVMSTELLCLRYLNIDHKTVVPVIEEIFLDSNHIQGRPTGKVTGNDILKLLADLSSQTKGTSSVTA